MNEIFSDEYFMKQALIEARTAFKKDEVPIGAVIVFKNKIIAKAHNLSETLNDATAHAEMQAITSATNMLGNKYLKDCTLYVTLEPCVMCAGACNLSQIGKIVFGARDEKKGYKIFNEEIILHKTKVVSGIMKQECSELISEFFCKLRNA